MSAWEEYRSTARARGAPACEFYAALSEPQGDTEAMRAALPDHLAYQAELERRGALVMAGPLSDTAGTAPAGIGLIIYRAASLEAARALAEADPMHASAARRFTLRRWMVNEGSLGLQVALSGARVEFS